MKIGYYAIFNYDEYDKDEEKYGISITFPDIPEANTCARNNNEGIKMALDVLQLCLVESEEGKLPVSTVIECGVITSIVQYFQQTNKTRIISQTSMLTANNGRKHIL